MDGLLGSAGQQAACPIGRGWEPACIPHGADPWLRAEGLRAWKGDGLKHLPDLHFTYEEEAQPEDFFVYARCPHAADDSAQLHSLRTQQFLCPDCCMLRRPYVWTLVVSHGSLPWSSQAITLFVAPTDGSEAQPELERAGSQQLSLNGQQQHQRGQTSSEGEV